MTLVFEFGSDHKMTLKADDNAPDVRAPDHRNSAPIYLVFSGELSLEKSAQDAWPHVIDYTSWQNYPIAQHVSGTPGEEGEVVRLKKQEGSLDTPPYYARTILLEPEHRVIWKVYPEDQGSGATFLGADEFAGFVDFKLDETENGTRFSYNTIYEWVISYDREEELEEFRRERYEEARVAFTVMWPRLKEVVEGSRSEKARPQDAA